MIMLAVLPYSPCRLSPRQGTIAIGVFPDLRGVAIGRAIMTAVLLGSIGSGSASVA